MENKMTIHRGLAELKLIDSKINKQIAEIVPVGISQKDRLVNANISKDDFERNATSKYDSVIDLIERKNHIKSEIVKANGKTLVKIAEKEMTIADAINFKSVIGLKREFIGSLKAKSQSSLADLNTNNDQVNKNVQAILEATFGKENVKVTSDDLESVRKPYMDSNEWHLFDPLKVNDKIESLEKEVDEFEVEVDAALSEINAVTVINI